jgi:hypothetical protein
MDKCQEARALARALRQFCVKAVPLESGFAKILSLIRHLMLVAAHATNL